jgi:hypothetical protein
MPRDGPLLAELAALGRAVERAISGRPGDLAED